MFGISIQSRATDPFAMLAWELAKRLAPAQKSLTTAKFWLRPPVLKSVAEILEGVAEDLHCGIGIGISLEAANLQLFGTPLPFLVESGLNLPPDEVTPKRVQHLLGSSTSRSFATAWVRRGS